MGEIQHNMIFKLVKEERTITNIIKESVELFAYPHRGSDKTLVQISKSPHLAVYIGMIYSYTNEECLSCLLSYLLKLSDFYVRVNAKHFHVTNMSATCSVTTQR